MNGDLGYRKVEEGDRVGRLRSASDLRASNEGTVDGTIVLEIGSRCESGWGDKPRSRAKKASTLED